MSTNAWIELPVTGGTGVSSLNGETGIINLVAGSGITVTPAGQNITIASTGGGGSVTSVALALPGSLFTISGSPVTTSGTLTGSFISQAQNSVFSGPTSGSGVPTFRALVAADIPPITLTGDVTGSGTGSFATTIAVGAVTDTKGSLATKPACTVAAITNQTLSGTPTIDGQATAVGSLILLTAQSSGSENGPWVAAAGAWSRPIWYPSGGTTQSFQFITTLIRLGTTYQGSTWRMTTAGPITIDTTATTWVVTPFAISTSTVNGILPIANGGTGQTTANLALNAFLPSQGSSAGSFLQTDGTNTSWAAVAGGTMPSSYAASTTVVTSATTTYVTAISTTITMTAASAPIRASAVGTFTVTGAIPTVAKIRVSINGVAGQEQLLSLTALTTNYIGAAQYVSANLGPGTYTVLFEIARNSGTGTVSFFEGTLTAVGLQGANSNGITQLTGDVTAGPGSGSQAATIAAASVTGAKIASATITGANIAATTITNGLIANTTINLTTKVTGTLPFANGGTGATTFANQRIPFSNGTNFLTDGLFLYDTTNTRLYSGQAGGTGRINATVSTTDPQPNDLAGNFFSRGTNKSCMNIQNENTLFTVDMTNSGGPTLGASILFESSRGTLAARTQSVAGDVLFTLASHGRTASAYSAGFASSITAISTDTVTDTTNGADLVFSTTPTGSATVSERFRITNAGHLKSTQATPPTIAVNANAGTGGSASIANATDTAGVVTIVTGTIGISTGSYATITFNKAFTVAPIVVLTPANSTLSTSVYVTSTTTTFDVNFAAAGGISSTYVLNYYVIETQ